jgi:hypothetical protein
MPFPLPLAPSQSAVRLFPLPLSPSLRCRERRRSHSASPIAKDDHSDEDRADLPGPVLLCRPFRSLLIPIRPISHLILSRNRLLSFYDSIGTAHLPHLHRNCLSLAPLIELLSVYRHFASCSYYLSPSDLLVLALLYYLSCSIYLFDLRFLCFLLSIISYHHLSDLIAPTLQYGKERNL